jgi:acetyl esterase/lipase
MKTKPLPSLLFGSLLLAAVVARGAEAPAPIDLWPGDAPAPTSATGPEKTIPGGPLNIFPKQVSNVSHPTLTLLKADSAQNSGVTVIVCPGGGFKDLETTKEGEDAIRWLHNLGINALMLKYRVSLPIPAPEYSQALQDAQRAISLVRSNATAWGLQPDHIGIMGFSAGAQLSIRAGTQFGQRTYAAVDAVDAVSCRPDFAIAIYPGGLVTKDGTDTLVADVHVPKDACQMFLAQAEMDRVNSENSILTFLALKRAGVPAEMHIYAAGVHGFGLKASNNPHATWPVRCEEWMAGQGLWKKPADPAPAATPAK